MKRIFLFLIGIAMIACTNDADKADKVHENMDGENTEKVYTADELAENFADLVGQEVTVEGIVNHVCKHGGTKMFIEGEENNVKIMAAESGNFIEDEVMFNKVKVTGIVAEDKYDKDRIMRMEADLEALVAEGKADENAEVEKDEEHGEGMHDEHNGDDEAEQLRHNIEYFKNILEESGKESISYYSLEASTYEITEELPQPENAEEGGCSEDELKADEVKDTEKE